MAGSDSNGSKAGRPLNKLKRKTRAIDTIPRRKLTLITITLLLNILLWSSFVCLVVCVYQIASDPKDTSNIAPVVLTTTSALATIAYTLVHTIFSLKQKIWEHQQRHTSTVKSTSYVAIRLAVSLCFLWLLTTGWNMIIVARRPVCLDESPNLQRWEYGSTCQLSRIGMAFAIFALIASCALFGVLGAVNRPFEAHLFKHGFQQPAETCPTQGASGKRSAARPVSCVSEKRPHGQRTSLSTRTSLPSNFSTADVATIDASNSQATSTIFAPTPVRSLGLEIFTSHHAPPPIPPVYLAEARRSLDSSLPPVFHPSMSHRSLTRPPRLSGLVNTSGFVPLSIPVQYSASTWRAIHPSSPSSIRPASRSYTHLPSAGFSYGTRYSRSSVSLTRPHRLSYATPAASSSSRSGSTGPEGRESSSAGGEGTATANEIAYAILNGTPIPGTTRPKGRSGHKRTASAPDATSGAQQSPRMAMGWKPQLQEKRTSQEQARPSQERPRPSHEQVQLPAEPSEPLNVARELVALIHSSSTHFFSRFSPDTSPDDEVKRPLERELVSKNIVARKPLHASESSAADSVRRSSESTPVVVVADAKMRTDVEEIHGTERSRSADAVAVAGGKRRRGTMVYEDVKNKPLPRIAVGL
ncbi:hypothetical protein BDW02DRAFT_98406 [Decorospora gaudefroyi]|uniref:Uncharacterized protein n=1 Tax=Decorospora gaudefroyi TaxID=184978 RepID=A0A6A5JZA5_9PLEO|nr:hypothetical protein BDW02DRAFT_98406 [Decorospora gaudefroyi]